MHDRLSIQNDRIARLEQSILTKKLCIEKTQAASLELRRKQDRIYSEVNLQEKTVINLNQEILVSGELSISFIDPPSDSDKVTQNTKGNTNTRVGDQNLYGTGPSVRNIYRMSNLDARVGDQNLYGPGPSVRNYYEWSNLRSIKFKNTDRIAV